MDIAIHLEKIKLRDDRFIFKPVGVIKGTYLDDIQTFDADFGMICDSIECGRDDLDDYFDSPTTIEELREQFGDVVPEEELLAEFLEVAVNNLYIGYYDYKTGFLKIKKIPYESFEMEDNFPMISIQGTEEEENILVTLDSMSLKELRDSKSLDEVKKFVDQIMNAGAFVQREVESTVKESKGNLSLKKEESKKFDLAKFRKEVLDSIVGQDEAVCDVTRTLAINFTSKNPRNKNHVLIMGPSGTGKTEMINVMAKLLDVPIFKADATAYTKAGYVGKDVPSMLTGLLTAAGGDLQRAQNGILVIDEIDKKSSNSKDDVSGKSVLHSMLKILDRDIIEVDIDPMRNDKLMFDTSNLTVVFMGSFDELYKEKKEKEKYKHKTVGFNSQKEEEKESKVRIDEDDLVKWLGPEFVGRIGTITSTDKLSLEDAINLLSKSKLSQLNILREDLEDRGIKLFCTHEYKKEIAKKGMSDTTGVRKLNKTIKDNVKYAYDEILTRDDVKVLKLTKATALDPRKYFLG